MTIEMITEGLRKLPWENNYNPATIKFYEREWNKIQRFLMEEYGDTEYQMERGFKYLLILSSVFLLKNKAFSQMDISV